MRSRGVASDGDCREGGTFAFSAIRLKLALPRSPTAPLVAGLEWCGLL